MGRKIVVGALAVLTVVILFVAYLRLTGVKGIPVVGVSSERDISFVPFDSDAQRIDDTVIHSVERSRYTIFDPQTKRIHRIYGFERLLNPGADTGSWQVKKPYVHLFENKFICQMNAEHGVFEVDTSGGTPILQSAQFSGKVAIRLTPAAGQKFSETVILIEDLSYNSEQSEFFTRGPVELVSAQSHLVGQGLRMVYNPAGKQIEYFEIQKLEYLRLKNVAASRLMGKSAEPNLPPAATENSTSVSAAGPQSEPNATQLYYQCTLNDSVRIVYGDQAIVEGADQINIHNILSGDNPDTANESPEQGEVSTASATQEQSSPSALPEEPNLLWENRLSLPKTAADSDVNDVVVTCRGKLVYRPMTIAQTVVAEVAETAQRSEPQLSDVNTPATTPAEQPELSQQSAYFAARKIDYDLKDGSVLAAGPVALRFHAPSEANDANSSMPVVITAQKEATFLADSSKTIRQVVFYGDVIGDAAEQGAASKSVRRLYGDVLTVDLGEDASGKMEMAHVAVTGKKVRLEAMQYLDGVKSSHVRLDCRQFDYEGRTQAIIAAGPGEIQLNNKDVPAGRETKARSFDFQGPCVALVNGFDTLTWRRADNKIQVDSSKDSMKMTYMTIKDGNPDAVINAQTMDAEIWLTQDAGGHDVLKEVIADNGVFVEQVGAHALKGQKLRYLGQDGWLYIEGGPSQPCFVDGVKVPAIQYNLLTEQLKTTLSTSPGAVVQPQ